MVLVFSLHNHYTATLNCNSSSCSAGDCRVVFKLCKLSNLPSLQMVITRLKNKVSPPSLNTRLLRFMFRNVNIRHGAMHLIGLKHLNDRKISRSRLINCTCSSYFLQRSFDSFLLPALSTNCRTVTLRKYCS